MARASVCVMADNYSRMGSTGRLGGVVVAVVFQSVERIRFSSGCVMADKYAGLGSPVGLDDKLAMKIRNKSGNVRIQLSKK